MSKPELQSNEVLREAIDKVGAKAVAHRLNISAALVYKWCQEKADEDIDGSGARNPLDRVLEIIRITGDHRIVNWLCNRTGGFYVAHPDPKPEREWNMVHATQEMLVHFTKVLSTVTDSYDNDGYITEEETRRIRAGWEDLKSLVEEFVIACERGAFLPTDEQAGEGKGETT